MAVDGGSIPTDLFQQSQDFLASRFPSRNSPEFGLSEIGPQFGDSGYG